MLHRPIDRSIDQANLDDIILAEMIYGHVYRSMGRVLNQPNFNTGDPPRSVLYINPSEA